MGETIYLLLNWWSRYTLLHLKIDDIDHTLEEDRVH
jgi:hypothetical protein